MYFKSRQMLHVSNLQMAKNNTIQIVLCTLLLNQEEFRQEFGFIVHVNVSYCPEYKVKFNYIMDLNTMLHITE